MGLHSQKKAAVDEAIIIEPWMCSLGLTSAELIAFALVYGCEQRNGFYDKGLPLITASCGISERQTTRLVGSLIKKGYLSEDKSSEIGKPRVLRIAILSDDKMSTPDKMSGDKMSTPDKMSPLDFTNPQVIPSGVPNIDSNKDLSWTDGWNSNQPTNRPTGGIGSQEDEIFSKLLTATVSPNRKRFARKPFDALLAQGFSGEEIIDAWKSVQEDARRRGGMNEGGKFMPQLTKWLENDAFSLLQERRVDRTAEAGPRLLHTNSSWIACYQGAQAVVRDEAGRIMPADSDRRDVMRAAVKMFEKGDR